MNSLLKNPIIIVLLLSLVLRIITGSFISKDDDPDGYMTFARSLYNAQSFGYDEIYYRQNSYPDLEKIFESNPNPISKKNGHRVILTTHYAIGWPFQVYLIYKLTGGINLRLIHIYQVILSTLTVLLFYFIGLELFNRKAALIIAIIAAINPIYIIDSASFSNEVSFLFFLLVSFYFFIRLLKNQNYINIILWTVFMGISTLIRPVAFLHFGLLCIALVIFRKFSFKYLLIPFIFIFVLSPWIIRNYISFHRFIPLTTFSGTAFFEGNNRYIFEEKSGSYSRQDGLWIYENKEFGPGDDCFEVSRQAQEYGMEFIKSLSFKELLLHEWYKIRLGFGLSTDYIFKSPEEVNKNIKYQFNNTTHPFTLKNILIYYPVFISTLLFFLFFFNKAKQHFRHFNIFLILFFAGIFVYIFHTLVYFAFMRYRAYLLDTFLIFSAGLFIYFIPLVFNFLNKSDTTIKS